VGPHRVTDLAWFCAARFTDCLDHDVRRRQRASLFGETATERLHEVVVDFLAADLSQQAPHLGDVLLVTPPLLSPLLEHGRAAGRTAWTDAWRTARSRRTHTWARRARSHRTLWARPTRTSWPIHRRTAWHWRRKLRLELASPATTTWPAATSSGTPPFAAKLITAMFPARRPAAVAVKLAVRVEIVGFQVAIDRLTAGACGAAPGRRLHHNQRGFVLLGYLRRREPGLLQRGILAEQRFLQRPSHTLSLQTKIEPPFRPSVAAAQPRATPVTSKFIHPPQLAVLQRYSITRGLGYRLTRTVMGVVEPTRPHGMRSSLTEG